MVGNKRNQTRRAIFLFFLLAFGNHATAQKIYNCNDKQFNYKLTIDAHFIRVIA